MKYSSYGSDPLFETIICFNKICRLSVAATLQMSQEEVGKEMGADAEAKNSVLKCLQV
jgi:hypothetical protein